MKENYNLSDVFMEYHPSAKEYKDFKVFDKTGRHNCPVTKAKALNGQLVHVEGNNVTVVKYDAPWALLQSIKRDMVKNGYKKANLRLRSL